MDVSAAAVSVLRDGDSDGYVSRFGRWDRRASVRIKPRRRMREVDGDGRVFFPPEFVPVVADPLVVERGPGVREELLVHALHQYLHFTTVLEQTAVLPVTVSLTQGIAGLDLPEAMRSDAFKITTDEAWHAQFCHDFRRDVTRVTGVPQDALVEPRFVRRLDELRAVAEPSMRPLLTLFFAIVSETLVSALLADIPNDKRLPQPVRAVVGDHAEDEGRHYAYFRSLLHVVWPQLSDAERRLVGPRVPEFVHVFLDPDPESGRRLLIAGGWTEDEAAPIVTRCYGASGGAQPAVRAAARGTVRAFREVGALDDRQTYDAFVSHGLVPSHGLV